MGTDNSEMISELRTRMKDVSPLEDEPDFFTSEETLVRFLKARNWDINASEKMLKETVEYRRLKRPMHMDCTWCHDKPGFHSMRQVGFDLMGRPVVYSNFSQAICHRNSVEDSITHSTYILENAKASMGPGVSTWVYILDCTGMTLPVCNPKLGYAVWQVMSNHYPERLGMVICVNHNAIFQGVYSAMKVFLPSSTVAKCKLARSKHKISELFQSHFSEEMTKWLLEEIHLNKTRPLPRNQIEFWNAPSKNNEHDPRGTPSYVKMFIEGFQMEDKINTKIHKPHPNIIDSATGKKVTASESAVASLQQKRDDEKSNGSANASDDDDENNIETIEIAKEYEIPEEAKLE
ncbi:hypothetical protein ACJMK2_010850 [Sinanodonta woodiana]|uniref:CRAL-TRIO domain-containing protein n=1 Tax=Sinanodonta woodiana TaxID=1069815 RepID=A0ABD3VGR5_SINWO